MDMRSVSLFTGYDLAQRVLDHTQGGVAALIDLAKQGETDWLEFKAAMSRRPEDRKNPKENEADGHWHVAKAVIALANTRGGVVFIGIDDTAQAVGLSGCDPRGIIAKSGVEAYLRREIVDRISPTTGPCKWTTGTDGTWMLEQTWPPDQFEVRLASYQGLDVAAILVRPVPKGGECLIALQDNEERLLHRAKGNIGQVLTTRGRRAIAAVEASRQPASDEFTALHESFLARIIMQVSPDVELEAAIDAWHSKFRERSVDLLTVFTPLDASEDIPVDDTGNQGYEIPVPREAFEPEAQEVLPDYIDENNGVDFDFEENASDLEAEDDLDRGDDKPAHIARKGGLFCLLNEEPRSVVLGEPGGGKTTSLRRLALEAADAYQSGGMVTLFVPLGRWQSAGGLWGLLRHSTGLTPGQIETLIHHNRCRLLLDALNECPEALRPSAINALKDLLCSYPDMPVVISARTAEATCQFFLPTFNIEPLSNDQRLAFLRAYFRDTAQAEALLARLQSQPGGVTLAANPLLLRMIVEVVKSSGTLPQGRAGLYRIWVNDWYRREALKAQRSQDPLPWTFDEARRGLASIALTARRVGQRSASDELAIQALADNVTDPLSFLDRLTHGILLLHEDGEVQFRHETFQEYFCAEALLDDPVLARGIVGKGDGSWGMILAYALELQNPPPSSIIDALWGTYPWIAKVMDFELNDSALIDPRLKKVFPLFESVRAGKALECGYSIATNLPSLLIESQYQCMAFKYLMEIRHEMMPLLQSFEIELLRRSISPSMAVEILRMGYNWPTWTTEMLDQLPRSEWLKNCTLNQAIYLIEQGLLAATDGFSRRNQWPMRGRIDVRAFRLGLIDATSYLSTIEAMPIARAIKEAILLFQNEIATKDDFLPFLNKTKNVVSAGQAVQLVQKGLASPGLYRPLCRFWIDKTHIGLNQARSLIKTGIMPRGLAVAKWGEAAVDNDPWLTANQRYPSGSCHTGTIKNTFNDNIFVSFPDGIEGVLHDSNFLLYYLKLNFGSTVRVIVESVHAEIQMLHLLPDPECIAQIKVSVDAYREGDLVSGIVLRNVRGGLLVDIGAPAFLPGSQMGDLLASDLDDCIGRTLQVKILRIDRERNNIVVSRRVIIDEACREQKLKFISEIKVGQLHKGTVKKIVDFGAFVDLDGVAGLLHVTDMSWGRIKHPSEKVKVGDQLEVMILDIDLDKERISLGLKQALPDPWQDIDATKYPIGTRICGKVVSLPSYGAFVEIEEGVEGLLHVSEISWTKKIQKTSDVFNIGDEVEAVVLSINTEEKKISLGMRQTEENPWEFIALKYPIGSLVKGTVRNVISYGAFVEIEEGVDGMIHISDMSWTRKIKHPSEVLKKGEEVETVVLEIDAANQRISLGLKQAKENPWFRIADAYKEGQKIKGKVRRVVNFGAFIELGDGIDGLVHISQISDEHVGKVEDVLSIGDEVEVRIVNIDPVEHHIGLSIKAAKIADEDFQISDEMLTGLRPGERLVDLSSAFDDPLTGNDQWPSGQKL
jgi:small subunit ribosomal protein S1